MTTIRPGFARLRLPDQRLSLLVAQSFSLGVTLVLLIVTAQSLFLSVYGSATLPYVYIAVAILGSAAFYGFAEAQRRWSLPLLFIATELLIVLFLFASWLGLALANAIWISFALLVSFSLIIQMGFVILGGQAGRLFDVRQVKRLFPRIVAGFAMGFLMGGFLVAYLARVMDRTENMLLVAGATSILMLAFLLVTMRRFHDEITGASVQGNVQKSEDKGKPLLQMLFTKFVLFIFLYQMLSAMASYLLDFILLDRAALRYSGSQALAEFLGDFSVAVNVTDVLFLAILAGFLLSRYGLKFGMAANPVVDGLMLVVMVAAGLILGPQSNLFFLLVAGTRLIDITLTDGTTRGSINTAYQALDPSERVTVQSGVEGIGVPVALGLTGLILLIFNNISGLTIVHVAAFALIITLGWIALGFLVFSHYSKALIKTIRHRALGEEGLTLDDSSSLSVLERMLASGNLSEVRLALDLLEEAGSSTLPEALVNLINEQDSEIRLTALERIDRLKVQQARSAVYERITREEDPRVLGSGLQAWCSLGESTVVDEVIPFLADDQPDVKLGAFVGLLRYGGIPGVLAAGTQLQSMEHSSDPADRIFVAQVIGQVQMDYFYQPLLHLLDDEDPQVRLSAVQAAGKVKNQSLVPAVINNLTLPATRSVSAAALVNYGEMILPSLERALTGQLFCSKEDTIRLVRISGQIQSELTNETLKKHIDHPDSEIRHQVLISLCVRRFRPGPNELTMMNERLKAEAQQAALLLTARQDIGSSDELMHLQRALEDDYHQVRSRIYLLLSFIYDPNAIHMAQDHLLFRGGKEKALALEMLDVTLQPNHKAILFPFIEAEQDLLRYGPALAKAFGTSSMTQQGRLVDIIENKDGEWSHSWTRASAVYAVGKLAIRSAARSVETAVFSANSIERETASWSLFKLDPSLYQEHVERLRNDPDKYVSELARQLD